MTKITVKQFGSASFNLFSPVDGLIYTQSTGGNATSATLPLSATARYLIEGSNLSYNGSGELTGGTIKKITYQAQASGGEFKTHLVASGLAFNVAAARTARDADHDYPVAFDPVWNYDASGFAIGANAPGIRFSADAGNDRFVATGGQDVFFGLGGKDTVLGGGGIDLLDGGKGNDHVSGGKGDDSLAGGAGDDTLDGGAGRDWFVPVSFPDLPANIIKVKVDLAAAKATGVGTDTLIKIENAYGSGSHDTLLGNGADNNLLALGGRDLVDGGAGDDTLAGSSGNDTITGGTGKDQFVFTAAGADYADKVKDFDVADDTVVLATSFPGLAVGKLAAENFVKGKAAKDGDDHVIYDKSSGKLWYDFDGDGTAAKLLIATLETRPALTAADIKIVDIATLIPDFII